MSTRWPGAAKSTSPVTAISDPDQAQHRPPAESPGERRGGEAGERRREQADGEAEADLGRLQAVPFEVEAEKHRR